MTVTSGIQLRWKRKKALFKADKNLIEFVYWETEFWKKKKRGAEEKVAEWGWVRKSPAQNTFWVRPRVTEGLSPFQPSRRQHFRKFILHAVIKLLSFSFGNYSSCSKNTLRQWSTAKYFAHTANVAKFATSLTL